MFLFTKQAARYASQPSMPQSPIASSPNGAMGGFGQMMGANRFSSLTGMGNNSNIAQAANQAQQNPNPLTQMSPGKHGLATPQGIQQMAKQGQIGQLRAQPDWLLMLTPYLEAQIKEAEVQTGGASSPTASNSSMSSMGANAGSSQGTAQLGTPQKALGSQNQSGNGAGGGGSGGNGAMQGQLGAGGGQIGAYGVVRPGWAALRPSGSPFSGVTKLAGMVGQPQPTVGATANMPAGGPGMPPPQPGLPAMPPPNGGAPVSQGMGQPSVDPSTGQPNQAPLPGSSDPAQQPGQPQQGAQQGQPGQPQQGAPNPQTGQPTTSPMQDPPPIPLPMNPPMAPQRQMTPRDSHQQGVIAGLGHDMQMADSPLNAGEAQEDMQAEASAMGSKTAAHDPYSDPFGYRMRLMCELAHAAFDKEAGLMQSGMQMGQKAWGGLKGAFTNVAARTPQPKLPNEFVQKNLPTSVYNRIPVVTNMRPNAAQPGTYAGKLQNSQTIMPGQREALAERVGSTGQNMFGQGAGGYSQGMHGAQQGHIGILDQGQRRAGSVLRHEGYHGMVDLHRQGQTGLPDMRWYHRLPAAMQNSQSGMVRGLGNHAEEVGARVFGEGGLGGLMGGMFHAVAPAGMYAKNLSHHSPALSNAIMYGTKPLALGGLAAGGAYGGMVGTNLGMNGQLSARPWAGSQQPQQQQFAQQPMKQGSDSKTTFEKLAIDIVLQDSTNLGDHEHLAEKIAQRFYNAAEDTETSRLLHNALADKMYAMKFASQDSDGRLDTAKSATGESKGLKFQYKDDHHAKGQDAWKSVSQYFKGHGKRTSQPNPSLGKHAMDACYANDCQPDGSGGCSCKGACRNCARSSSFNYRDKHAGDYTFDAEDCPKCGASMEGDPYSGSCNSCQHKWGTKKAYALCTPFARGFFDKCDDLGIHPVSAVEKVGSDYGEDALRELRDGLEKIAGPWDMIGKGVGSLIGAGEKYLPGATNFGKGLFNATPKPTAGTMGAFGAKAPAAAIPGKAFQAGQQVSKGLGAVKGQALPTLGGGAMGAFGGEETPFDTGSQWGNIAMGAAAFNPRLNRMVGGKGVGALGNPITRGIQGGLMGASGGQTMDMIAGVSGLQGADGKPSTHFGTMGGRLGAGFGGLSGTGRALRNLAPAGGRLQQMGQKAMAFGEGGLAPIRRPFNALGQLTGMSAKAPSAMGRFADTARMGRNAAMLTSGVIGSNQLMHGLKNNLAETARDGADEYLQSRLPEMQQSMGDYAHNFMQQHGMMDDQGHFNPLAGVNRNGGLMNHAMGGVMQGADGIFHSMGMDPSKMSPLQKMMILGGTGMAGGGALAGSPVMAGMGGLAALGGFLPHLMPNQGQQRLQQQWGQQGGQQGMGPNQPQPNTPQARNEWETQAGPQQYM